MIPDNHFIEPISEVIQILNNRNSTTQAETGDEGAVKQSTSEMALSLLDHAISFNDLEVLKYAIEQGIEPKEKYDYDEHPITRFIQNNNLEAVQFLIDQGVALSNYNQENSAIIGIAIQNHNFEMAKLLHKHGVAVDIYAEHYDNEQGRARHPEHVYDIIFSGSDSSDSTFHNFFAIKWLETFGWPKDTVHWRYHRSTIARNIFNRVAHGLTKDDMCDDQSLTKLLDLIFQEYKVPNPPAIKHMRFLECQINKELHAHPEGWRKLTPFRFNDYLNMAILRGKYPLLEFLLKSNWIYDFRVPFGDKKRLVSPVWAAAHKTNDSMWSTFVQAPSVVEQARRDYLESPSTFFSLLSELPLHELENMKDLELDFTAADHDGNTFFHYLSSQADLKKGHLYFSMDVGADNAFSMKNKQGHTPFDIPHTKGYDRTELQSYFEQIILPKTLRKTMKELPKPIPTAIRRRM